jgi:NAD(P)-dependent dehydrogenase (short-subunit alcohol dehydrogenase family)
MRTEISGRRALITGAGSGIGRAIACRLSELGCEVVLVGRTKSALETTREFCEGAGDKAAVVCPCDLRSEEAICDLVGTLRSAGGLDILINNAGIMVNSALKDTPTKDFDAIMSTNVRAPFLLMRECFPLLARSAAAEIVNICSVVAHEGYPNQSVYAASKHALLGLSKSFAREVYKDGIRVHVISPGGVLTDMVAVARPDLVGAAMIEPDDMADAVEYLLCHRTGAVCDEIRLHRSSKEPF